MCVTNQENCVTVSFQFQTMSVTYQVNYHIKFSEYVCDISGKLYHCMIPFSDNVCDISGQLPCQRSRRRKKMGGKRTEKITAVRVTTTTLPVNRLTATDYNAAAFAYFLTMGVTYLKNCITLSSHFPTMPMTYQTSLLEVWIVFELFFLYSLFELNIVFSFSNQSLVVSTETKKKVTWTWSKSNSKTHIPTGSVFKLFFLFPIGITIHFFWFLVLQSLL